MESVTFVINVIWLSESVSYSLISVPTKMPKYWIKDISQLQILFIYFPHLIRHPTVYQIRRHRQTNQGIDVRETSQIHEGLSVVSAAILWADLCGSTTCHVCVKFRKRCNMDVKKTAQYSVRSIATMDILEMMMSDWNLHPFLKTGISLFSALPTVTP